MSRAEQNINVNQRYFVLDTIGIKIQLNTVAMVLGLLDLHREFYFEIFYCISHCLLCTLLHWNGMENYSTMTRHTHTHPNQMKWVKVFDFFSSFLYCVAHTICGQHKEAAFVFRSKLIKKRSSFLCRLYARLTEIDRIAEKWLETLGVQILSNAWDSIERWLFSIIHFFLVFFSSFSHKLAMNRTE